MSTSKLEAIRREADAYTKRKMLKIPEVAFLLSISTRTVHRLLASGELQGVRVGRSVRIRSVEIDRLLGTTC